MEKFEFYGAPDIEREMTEGLFGSKKSPAQQRLDRQRASLARMRATAEKKGVIIRRPTTLRGKVAHKLKSGMKMVFGKLRRVEDIESELAVLESTNSPFPEVRECRIQELQEELERLSEQGENYSQMTLGELARVIRRVWKKINYAAQPYVDAMATMDEMDPYKARYIHDPGSDIVARFLVNASTFRGPEAKAIKDELKKRMKRK